MVGLPVINDCTHYHERVKGCTLHTRCKQGDKVAKGEASSIAECPDYVDRITATRKQLCNCPHFTGKITGERVRCISCVNTQLDVFQCTHLSHGECTPKKQAAGIQCCVGCPDNPLANVGLLKAASQIRESEPAPKPWGVVTWAYGVTTVPQRRNDLLPKTLASLKAGGFDSPRLFVDGDIDAVAWRAQFGLDVTARWPAMRTAGNWYASMVELYLRNPQAERFAIFQDDFVTYKNLRAYLDGCEYPAHGYWNLYTFPSNQALAKGDGWFEAAEMIGEPDMPNGRKPQRGRGAVALVFDRRAMIALITSEHFALRPQDMLRGHRAVDGGIVTALNKAGWREYVHSPSLVQHTGDVSSMGNNPHKKADSFRGERFDAAQLLTTVR